MKTTLKELKLGDYFTIKDIENPTENQVYIRGDYERTEKKYSYYKFNDTNSEKFATGTKEVFIGFTF